MFVGEYNNSIDDRNRLIIPSKMRDELGQKCILAKGVDPCIEIYPEQAWNERMMHIMSSLRESKKESRAILRTISKNAVNTEVDKQGRVVLPQGFIRDLNIKKDVVTVGATNKIEVWSKATWDSDADVEEFSFSHEKYAGITEGYDF
ncbi:MAG: division/cell wall cluster transcriptional repressor MraZ [Eubacterium sp.]|nr:division/cell wall cluster transcriptional repressor MraZ [Eubacterium sp.]